MYISAMKFRLLHIASLCALLLAVAAPLRAQSAVDQRGGLYITARGTVNALVIFAQFPDDSLDREHGEWPINQPPQRIGTWIDSVWTGSPTPYSMTDYFNEMSLGTYRFIGKARYVIAPHTRKEYMELGMKRADIHRELLQKLDATTDFSEFDRWDPEGDYKHIERPDGIVDMVLVIWRNVLTEIPNAEHRDSVRSRLDFANDIEDLGFGPPVPVDNGARVVAMGYGMNGTTPIGSGLTVRKPLTRIPFLSVMQTSIHEVGHYLLGWNEYHVGFGFWGMLSTYGIRSYATNSFERHRLGWINLISIDKSDTLALSGISLPDFITTGVAARFVVDSASGKCFYIENHQRISRWDIPSQVLDERGLYVLRQDNEIDTSMPVGRGDQMRMVTADGRYDWEVHRRETNSCCGDARIPVFKKLEPNRHTGYHHCDLIPFIDPDNGNLTSFEVILTEDAHGNSVLTTPRAGTGTDAFRPGLQTVFSPWSNPNSQDVNRNYTGFGFEISGLYPSTGGDVYTIDMYAHTSTQASPARIQYLRVFRDNNHPQIRWQPNEEPDLRSYRIYRSIAPTASQPDTADFELAAELPAFDANNIPIEQWRDNAVELAGSQDKRRYYALEAVDSTGKRSVKSYNWIGYDVASGVAEHGERTAHIDISPNPASGRTVLGFSLPAPAQAVVELYTVQGSRVAVVVSAPFDAGYHTAELDLSSLPAGVYLARLTSGTLRADALLIRSNF